MRRFVPILIGGAALIAAACGEPLAPTQAGSIGRFGGPPSAAKDAWVPSYATRVQVTIPADGGVISVGAYRVYFSPKSVCDPATSGYGQGTWDNACTTLSTDYTLPAAYWTENGVPFVEFLDDLRFDPKRLVVMVVKAPAGASDIVYFKRGTSGEIIKVMESGTDASLTTYFSESTGELFRRVKHFSGWTVASGRYCEEGSIDPECQEGQ